MVMTGKRSGLDSAVRAGCPNGGISDKPRSLVRYLVAASLSALLNVVQDPNVQSYLKTRLDGVIEVSVKEQNGQIKQIQASYPPMRLLDLYFWSYGLKENFKNKIKTK